MSTGLMFGVDSNSSARSRKGFAAGTGDTLSSSLKQYIQNLLKGIRFRGMSIPEYQKVLSATNPRGEPLPEGLIWLLLTGKVKSEFQKAYEKGIHKSKKVHDGPGS